MDDLGVPLYLETPIFVLKVWNHDGPQCPRTTVKSESEYEYTGVNICLFFFQVQNLKRKIFDNHGIYDVYLSI